MLTYTPEERRFRDAQISADVLATMIADEYVAGLDVRPDLVECYRERSRPNSRKLQEPSTTE
ncbi:hypothetical protein GCM10028864_54700 [Microlunatus parietis]